MTTYFSVDIESTGTSPSTGRILSFGCAIVRNEIIEPNSLYTGCKFNPNETVSDPSTMKWWEEQDEKIRHQAFNWTISEPDMLLMIFDWVSEQEPEYSNRCFVANPVAFDFAMVNDAFIRNKLKNPWGYRALCLRSMRFAFEFDKPWGLDRDDRFKSNIPHHALSDAIAQAKDLIELLEMRG